MPPPPPLHYSVLVLAAVARRARWRAAPRGRLPLVVAAAAAVSMAHYPWLNGRPLLMRLCASASRER